MPGGVLAGAADGALKDMIYTALGPRRILATSCRWWVTRCSNLSIVPLDRAGLSCYQRDKLLT